MSDPVTLLKQAKEAGKKVVGFYCVFAPQELVLAADALGFALCATKEEPIADGEKTLPRNFCPLITEISQIRRRLNLRHQRKYAGRLIRIIKTNFHYISLYS